MDHSARPNLRAADALVATLKAHGIDRIFCVPGESYLAFLDALHDEPAIQLITCRHEGGAGFMAVADAKLTGRPGVCLVSRAPGAMNAAIAVHTAQQDAVPLLLLVGQVTRAERGRKALQEMDYRPTFADSAKLVVEIDDPSLLAETAARLLHVARSGIPGPVVLSMPEDMQDELARGGPAEPRPLPSARPEPDAVARVARAIAGAKKPLLIAGHLVHGDAARASLQRVAERLRVPVAVSFRHQDLFTNDHPLFAAYLGYKIPPSHVAELAAADLVVAIGTRLGDITTQGFCFPTAPRPTQTLIHVLPDATELGRVYQTDDAIVADPVAFLDALAALPAASADAPRDTWITHLASVRTKLAQWQAEPASDGLIFGHLVRALAQQLPHDAMIATDAGTFTTWLHRYFPFRASHRMLAPISGAMGFGVPGATAAGLREPTRTSVVLVGDGGYLMTGNELATAQRYGVPIKIFLADNGAYGSIRLNQEVAYPTRVIGTSLTSPDFVKLGEAFGALAIGVTRAEEVDAAVARALAHKGAAMVVVKSSLETTSAYTTLAQARHRAKR